MDIIIENNEVREANTFWLLGYSFIVDKVTYYVPIDKVNQCSHCSNFMLYPDEQCPKCGRVG